MNRTAALTLLGLLALSTTPASAKLPPPSDEAKAKAAEAAAKTAHNGKVDNYKLCMAMDRVANGYQAASKQAGKAVPPPTETPACTDPGPFVYTPPGAASAPAAAAPTAAAPAPVAAAPAAAAKK
jgi:hypothetical protein